MRFSFEFAHSDTKRLGKALEEAKPEVWLARSLAPILPPGSHLKLLCGGKDKSFRLYLRNGRLAWEAKILIIPPTDSAGQPNRRFAIEGNSFSYYDPKLPVFLATFPLG